MDCGTRGSRKLGMWRRGSIWCLVRPYGGERDSIYRPLARRSMKWQPLDLDHKNNYLCTTSHAVACIGDLIQAKMLSSLRVDADKNFQKHFSSKHQTFSTFVVTFMEVINLYVVWSTWNVSKIDVPRNQ